MYDGKAWVIDGLRNGNSRRVAIDCQQAPFRPQLGEDQTRVTTAAKGSINVDTIWTNIQAVNGFIR